jgi:hypothetical protein
MLVEADVTIEGPLEQVFDAVTDLRNEVTWDPRVTGVELLTGEPIGQDGRFALIRDGVRYDAVLRRHQRPHLLEISATGPQMRWRTNFALMDGAAGTVLIGRFERHLRGLRRLAEPFSVRAFRAEATERLQAVKRFVES